MCEHVNGALVFARDSGTTVQRHADSFTNMQHQTAVEILQLVNKKMAGDNASVSSADRDSIGGAGSDNTGKGVLRTIYIREQQAVVCCLQHLCSAVDSSAHCEFAHISSYCAFDFVLPGALKRGATTACPRRSNQAIHFHVRPSRADRD